MFLSLFHTLRHQYQLRQTISTLQRRADDRLLDDIGLTRDDLLQLMANPPARPIGRKPARELSA